MATETDLTVRTLFAMQTAGNRAPPSCVIVLMECVRSPEAVGARIGGTGSHLPHPGAGQRLPEE